VNPSIVLDILINNQPLVHFNWTDLSTAATGSFRIGGNLNITSFHEVYVALNINDSTYAQKNSTFSFFNPSEVPKPNQYLKFDIDTLLQNDFTRVFLPPTALAVASEINPSGTSPIILFDGSTSFQSGGNSSIVQWEWFATNQLHHNATNGTVGPLFGEEVQLSPGNFTPDEAYWVNLTVTNSVGLDGTTSISYIVP